MKKRAYLAAAAICAAGIGIAGAYLTACGNDARQTSGSVLDGTEVSGNGISESGVSENSISGNMISGNGISENAGSPNAVSENDTSEEGLLPGEERVKVKGIYVTGAMAGMVIDVKNDDGRVVYEMDTPMVSEIGSSKKLVSDMPGLIQKCKEHDIYLIARIVAFKDPFLAENRTDLALHDESGNLFRDSSGLAWVNPYKEEVWKYLLEIAEEAVAIGFDEIQFDYIRFATDSGMKNVDFGPEAEGKSREAVITEFVEYASERLHSQGIPVSADVYGIVIDSELDASLVGQNYYEMSKYLDYISPMVYPSHYGPGNLGLAVPDAQPYETIYRSMSASRRVLAGLEGPEEEVEAVSGNDIPLKTEDVSGNGAVSAGARTELPEPKEMEPAEEIRAQVRPWLQDFTATWVDGHITYGPEEIRAQIQAVYDAGYEEWILWNAANRYTEGGLLPEEEN